MPGFEVALNGERVAAVSTEGRNILSVRVHGDVLGPEFANIDVSGGLYGEEPSVSLTWVNQQHLSPGDEVEVAFLDAIDDSHAGKTIEELFPDEPEPTSPGKALPDMFEELSRRPKVREGFSFRLYGPEGEIVASTLPSDYSFGFSVTWNWVRPDRVSVSLSSNSLDSLEKRTGGSDHAYFKMHCGQRVKFRVDA